MPGPARAGFAIWLTGLPSSGKTALAHELSGLLGERGIAVQILDSDELRRRLTPNPDYSAEERDWFYDTITFLAELLTANGVHVVIAATACRRAFRQRARDRIARFAEVYVACGTRRGCGSGRTAGRSPTCPGKVPCTKHPAPPRLR
jgi:adenylylsulfate kinase